MSTSTDSAADGSTRTGNEALPPLIDMDDVLDRIERNTDSEAAAAYLDDIRAVLERVAERDPSNRESLLGDLDNLVDSLRMHVDGDADFWAETVQNRVANYRRTRRETSDTLHFSAGRLTVDGDEPVDPTDHRGEKATLRGTLVNQGERGAAVVQLAFYNEADEATWTVESCEFDLDAGEQRTLNLHVWIPEDADYYGIAVLDPADTRTTGPPPTRA
jgi:plasmid stabilization system protein ParE